MEQEHAGGAPDTEFYARCPFCEAVFRVGDHKLQLRQGKVRCGACREVFNAIEHRVGRNHLGLFEQLEAAELTEAGQGTTGASAARPSVREIINRNLVIAGIENADDSSQQNHDRATEDEAQSIDDSASLKTSLNASGKVPDYEAYTESESESVIESEAESHAQVNDDANAGVDSEQEPEHKPEQEQESEPPAEAGRDHWFKAEPDPGYDNNPFAERQVQSNAASTSATAEKRGPSQINMQGVDEYIMDRPNPLVGFFWFLIAAGFVVLLGLQVKYYFVDRFAQDERYRPYLSVFCKVASCELQPRRDAYRFTITNTRIDLHPTEPGALRITVKLLNQATFSQPYPDLQLTLTDRVGRVVGRRRFDPGFFLEPGRANRLDSGELGSVVFDLARPHEKAVGFVVDIMRSPA